MKQSNNTILTAYKTAHNIPLDTPLLTFAAWSRAGYTVKHGEASKHRVRLWAGTGGKYYKKYVSLFTADQVEKMEG